MSTANASYLLGNEVSITFQVLDINTNPTDPTAYSVTTTSGTTRTVTTYSWPSSSNITKLNTGPGLFQFQFTPNETGVWRIKSQSSGNVNSAAQVYIDIFD